MFDPRCNLNIGFKFRNYPGFVKDHVVLIHLLASMDWYVVDLVKFY